MTLSIASLCCRRYSSKCLRVGGVVVNLKAASAPEFVPRGYIPSLNSISQSDASVLKWMLQKDQLKQDIFLIGFPGARKRRLAMQFLELTEKEYEYLALTRDITESDIKQRREIKEGSAFYVDQAAIRAALLGRVLILDGIEKAERNVLPVLNNLLENREVQLDDGRFLVSPDKYDKLLQDHSEQELAENYRLARVSPSFRIIALGVPVPKFRGHPLDPPLRSRFQSKSIEPLSYQEQLEKLCAIASNVPETRLTDVLSLVYGTLVEECKGLGIPDFPVDNLPMLAKLWALCPTMSSLDAIQFLYPYKIMTKKGSDGKEFEPLLKALNNRPDKENLAQIRDVTANVCGQNQTAVVDALWSGSNIKFTVPKGVGEIRQHDIGFVDTKSRSRLLANMILSHAVHDFCLIGPRGCGKSMLVSKFASLLGYDPTVIMMYQDMTSRDLIQQRRILANGDTVWHHSPLIDAALSGGLAVLDGLHRVHHSTLNAISSLIHDREIELFDGTRLLRHDRFNMIKEACQLNDLDMKKRKMLPIHPNFRIVALAEPPNASEVDANYLTAELLNHFLFHNVGTFSAAEQMQVLSGLVSGAPEAVEKALLSLVETLRHDSDLHLLAKHLTSRQVLRIVKRQSAYPDECLHSLVKKTCLSRYLPQLVDINLTKALESCQIVPRQQSSENITYTITNNKLTIGRTSAPIFHPDNETMVPDILFYDNQEHLEILEQMLRDYLLGEHILLVGNQGVGKNKVADKFLQLLNLPRQYMQLHRDTTVQTLTVQITVKDGIIVYEDSPLVKAVRHGHALVIDEGDKAPTQVTVILKSLLESGRMTLADGRQIIPHDAPQNANGRCIRTHKNFRIIVLANRPGFPFLGNDFYGSLGDLFSCHIVDNPKAQSELDMLKKYGPNVDSGILLKLSAIFDELRRLNDESSLNYPYSTRELVNIVKHLQVYPRDPLGDVVRNVFDFDSFEHNAKETIERVLSKHGILPKGAQNTVEVRLTARHPLPAPKSVGKWGPGQPSVKLSCDWSNLLFESTTVRPVKSFFLDKGAGRSHIFTEEISSWQLPFNDLTMASDVVSSDNSDTIYVTVVNPSGVYKINTFLSHCLYVDLPVIKHCVKPRLKIYKFDCDTWLNHVLVQEETTNNLWLIDGSFTKIFTLSDGSVSGKFFTQLLPGSRQSNAGYRMIGGPMYFIAYERSGSKIRFYDLRNARFCDLSLSQTISSVMTMSETSWLMKTMDNKLFEIRLRGEADFNMVEIIGPGPNALNNLSNISVTSTLPNFLQSLSDPSGNNDNITKLPSRLIASDREDIYGFVSFGYPDSKYESGTLLYFPKNQQEISDDAIGQNRTGFSQSASRHCFLPFYGISVAAVPAIFVPRDKPSSRTGDCLEIIDYVERTVCYLSVPKPMHSPHSPVWFRSLSETSFVFNSYGQEGAVTVDCSGAVRTWEVATSSLNNSINAWKRMIGLTDDQSDDGKITIEKTDGDLSKLTGPKHGVTDPTGAPHFGGNTFAGGSGGFNTAGLGGAGGPYRLDLGHKQVYQLPDRVKGQVPEHVRQKAREMAKGAYQQRLREIQMSEFEADLYHKFYGRIERHVARLRNVIESLQARSKERQWIRHQTSGDLDEGKIIDGITGEKSIYRRRADVAPEPGGPQMKPKRLRICPDLSGSIYRFNGYDGRLERCLEACLMTMKALDGFETKIVYDVIGHSGEQPQIEIVDSLRPPKDDKRRLMALKAILAHSQFCISGDHTLEATAASIKYLAEQSDKFDESFLVVLSDANFDRYNISPETFARLIKSQSDKVHVFALFIGSLGDEAQKLRTRLPSNKAFICSSAQEIPDIMQQIFSSVVI